MIKPLILPREFIACAKSPSFRDKVPLHSGMTVLGFNGNKIKELATVRFYWGKGMTCYCAVWLHVNKYHAFGTGKTTGYGYHHQSAALSAALRSMGIKLGSFDPDSRGESSMKSTLCEIARTMGYKNSYVVEFYG